MLSGTIGFIGIPRNVVLRCIQSDDLKEPRISLIKLKWIAGFRMKQTYSDHLRDLDIWYISPQFHHGPRTNQPQPTRVSRRCGSFPPLARWFSPEVPCHAKCNCSLKPQHSMAKIISKQLKSSNKSPKVLHHFLYLSENLHVLYPLLN